MGEGCDPVVYRVNVLRLRRVLSVVADLRAMWRAYSLSAKWHGVAKDQTLWPRVPAAGAHLV